MDHVAPVEALIIVDMQRGFVSGPEALPNAGRLLDRVTQLLDRARTAGAVVVHLQNDGAAGQVDEPGTPGWELVLAHDSEPVVRKTVDDGFAEPALGRLLDANGVRRVAVCGLMSQMCVSATVRGALGRGLGVVVPRDGHATYDLEEIPASVVARVAEHALGDEPDFADTATTRFTAPPR